MLISLQAHSGNAAAALYLSSLRGFITLNEFLPVVPHWGKIFSQVVFHFLSIHLPSTFMFFF